MPIETLNLPAIAGGQPIFDQLLPIARPEGLPGEDFLADVRKIIASRSLTNGSFVRELEAACADYLHVAHCVAVANCTSALMLVLKILDLHGEVIVPSFTFHATAHAVAWNGLKPVFADCHPHTFCLDPDSVRSRASANTAAILPVHMFGVPVDVARFESLAAELRVPVIYDAAHAMGTRVNVSPAAAAPTANGSRRNGNGSRNGNGNGAANSKTLRGTLVGAFGVAEIFSLSPTKLLVAGEGGIISTQDAALARRLRVARNYGDAGDLDPESLGLNARLTEFHAALALRGIGSIDQRIARRDQIRLRYEKRLGAVAGLRFQQIPAGARTACKDFAIIIDQKIFGRSRDWLHDALTRENIGTRRYFSPPVHRQKLYRQIWDGRPLPVTDEISDGILCLPIYSSLTDADKVCDAIVRVANYAKHHAPAPARTPAHAKAPAHAKNRAAMERSA